MNAAQEEVPDLHTVTETAEVQEFSTEGRIAALESIRTWIGVMYLDWAIQHDDAKSINLGADVRNALLNADVTISQSDKRVQGMNELAARLGHDFAILEDLTFDEELTELEAQAIVEGIDAEILKLEKQRSIKYTQMADGVIDARDRFAKGRIDSVSGGKEISMSKDEVERAETVEMSDEQLRSAGIRRNA